MDSILQQVETFIKGFVLRFPESLREDLIQEARIAAWLKLQKDPETPLSHLIQDAKYRVRGVAGGSHKMFKGTGYLEEDAISAGGAGDYDYEGYRHFSGPKHD